MWLALRVRNFMCKAMRWEDLYQRQVYTQRDPEFCCIIPRAPKPELAYLEFAPIQVLEKMGLCLKKSDADMHKCQRKPTGKLRARP